MRFREPYSRADVDAEPSARRRMAMLDANVEHNLRWSMRCFYLVTVAAVVVIVTQVIGLVT